MFIIIAGVRSYIYTVRRTSISGGGGGGPNDTGTVVGRASGRGCGGNRRVKKKDTLLYGVVTGRSKCNRRPVAIILRKQNIVPIYIDRIIHILIFSNFRNRLNFFFCI